ncbi:TlpA family protein disulfide reductase [Frigoribacterium sp. NBH87]|uniref:TlpA family protein disulfide reductase n=1 Tax=Frigoribacterium sp. NBH87 TaxID=2596916 RepID=UPI00162A13AB|nr:TlpA disulfide reductase family protein [Frigoribacterium sp. NBH87]QNE42570.1 TlpA family protein disulfide reductase [Frigoribacterium sp. NBH87]
MRRPLRPLLAAAVAVVLAVTTAGCSSSDSVADQYADGSTKNYIAGDGTVVEIPPANRGEAVTFSSTTELGEPLESTDYDGDVMVVNFWYAACPPCRAEAPDLEALHQQYKDQGVSFIGVNVRDQASTAVTFAEKFGVTYPSAIDITDSAMQLAFAGQVPPNAVPTTIVVDREGRTAARVTGRAEKSILESLITTVLDETP